VIPAFFPYYWPILISRMFFGFGSALFVTLSVSYITDLYDGDMQRKLLGWRQAVGNLGDVVLLFVASLLITINWQSTYLIFFLLFVPMVLVGMFIPKEFDNFSIRSALVDDEGHVVDKSASQKQTTNWQVLWLAFIFLVVSMLYNVMSIKLASYVVDEGIGSA
ncbi:MFS transporter, partial [Bifidobacterium longum]